MHAVLARLAHELRLVGVALQFLTRVPVRFRAFDPAWLNPSSRHFPLVGALVGSVGAAVLALAAPWWPVPVAVLLSMAATVAATGGFHEDGLADTCDGLGGSAARERALAIMKDSRLGSYGVLGLAFTLALKAAVLCALLVQSPVLAAAALVWAHAASRAAAVALLTTLPYAGDAEHAKAKPMAQRARAVDAAVALGWVAVLGAVLGLGLLAPLHLLLSAACAAAVAAWCARWFLRRLGGYTGDTLGATQQWAELAVYLAVAAAHG
jgi:adenosylcobinamide-GDP ribazoletransferase